MLLWVAHCRVDGQKTQMQWLMLGVNNLGLPVLNPPVRSLAKQQQPRGANRNVRPEAFFGEAMCQEIEALTAEAFQRITSTGA